MTHPGVRGQDEADGRALRELREALPEEWRIEVWYTSKRIEVSVCDPTTRGPRFGDDSDVVNFENGATIAEAADACRRALTHD